MSSPTPPEPKKPDSHCERVEPIIYLLFAGVIFSLLLLIGVSKVSPSDGQTFQIVGNVVMTLLGMLGMRIKPAASDKSPTSGTVVQDSGPVTVNAPNEPKP